MDIEILYKPAHTMAKVSLSPGENITAESGAMVGTSLNVQMETSAGGVFKGLKRMFGGESFFRNTFSVADGSGEVLLAPPLCGDMETLQVGEGGWFVQSTSYVASSAGIELETKVGGFKTFFAGEGIFVLRAHGHGQVVVSSFGALEEVQVSGQMIIDTGHLVAWEDSPNLTYRVTKAGKGWIASFLSGEGLVCEFNGEGRVLTQSRNPSSFGRLVGRLLPPIKR